MLQATLHPLLQRNTITPYVHINARRRKCLAPRLRFMNARLCESHGYVETQQQHVGGTHVAGEIMNGRRAERVTLRSARESSAERKSRCSLSLRAAITIFNFASNARVFFFFLSSFHDTMCDFSLIATYLCSLLLMRTFIRFLPMDRQRRSCATWNAFHALHERS